MRVSTSPEEDSRPKDEEGRSGVRESGRDDLKKRDLEIINANAERLNEEAADTLEYQADWSAE